MTRPTRAQYEAHWRKSAELLGLSRAQLIALDVSCAAGARLSRVPGEGRKRTTRRYFGERAARHLPSLSLMQRVLPVASALATVAASSVDAAASAAAAPRPRPAPPVGWEDATEDHAPSPGRSASGGDFEDLYDRVASGSSAAFSGGSPSFSAKRVGRARRSTTPVDLCLRVSRKPVLKDSPNKRLRLRTVKGTKSSDRARPAPLAPFNFASP